MGRPTANDSLFGHTREGRPKTRGSSMFCIVERTRQACLAFVAQDEMALRDELRALADEASMLSKMSPLLATSNGASRRRIRAEQDTVAG